MIRSAIRYELVGLCLMVIASATNANARETNAAAQATPSSDSTPSEAAANKTATSSDAAAAQAKAAFDKSFDTFKQAFREVEQLRIKYQTADPTTREKINAQLTGQLAHTQSLATDLIQSALEAYRLAPNTDPQVKALLASAARYHTIGQQDPRSPGLIDGGDQYEKALPIIKQLVEGGGADRDVYLWGFIAAFATADYDLAAEYLKQAQELPASDKQPDEDDPAHKLMVELVSTFAPILEQHRELWKSETTIRAAEAKADDLPRVKLTTTKGEITLELFENEAPQAVANFLSLVKQGFYTDSPFHRVLSGFMAQGGAKTEDGQGGPGYVIRCECYQQTARKHFRGSLSMAHAGRDTGSSQFFLTFRPTPHLDGKHTVFGRVIDGMEVLGDIQRRNPQEPNQPAPDRILKAEVLRDRGHEYKFEKLPGRG